MAREKESFILFGLKDCPRQFIPLLYDRTHSSFAERLLKNKMFETNIPEKLRVRASMSLESLVENKYFLRRLDGQGEATAHISTLIDTPRPANPCLCLTFLDDKLNLLSLLLFNEFQMPLGAYIHSEKVFVMYVAQSKHEITRFFNHEYGPELIQKLQQIDSKHDLEQIVSAKRQSSESLVAIGFNKSFGHTCWNDVLGYLYLRDIKKTLLPHKHKFLLGQRSWLNPKQLINTDSTPALSTIESTNYALNNRMLIHMPMGFRINSRFENFWKHEVSSNTSVDTLTQLKNLRKECYPIISFNLRFDEYWRYGWSNQFEQLTKLFKLLRSKYSKIGIILDGMTRYWPIEGCHSQPIKSSTCMQLSNWLRINDIPYCDLDALPIADKISAYQVTDYSVAQFGSGEAIPYYIYSKNSITICGNTELIDAYCSSESITRLCKKDFYDNPKIGVYLPAEFISHSPSGFLIKEPRGFLFILNEIDSSLSCDVISPR